MSRTNRDDVIDTPQQGDLVKENTKTKKPKMYNVIMLNDDFTPMDFVVELLQRVFRFSREQAVKVMFEVHRKGKGLCGTYTFEVAEMKVTECMTAAGKAQHPLQVCAEPE